MTVVINAAARTSTKVSLSLRRGELKGDTNSGATVGAGVTLLGTSVVVVVVVVVEPVVVVVVALAASGATVVVVVVVVVGPAVVEVVVVEFVGSTVVVVVFWAFANTGIRPPLEQRRNARTKKAERIVTSFLLFEANVGDDGSALLQ